MRHALTPQLPPPNTPCPHSRELLLQLLLEHGHVLLSQPAELGLCHHAADEGLFADVAALGALQGVKRLAGNLQLRGGEGEGRRGSGGGKGYKDLWAASSGKGMKGRAGRVKAGRARDQQGRQKLVGSCQLNGVEARGAKGGEGEG